jgi:autotransporter-associated beta strand protein
VLTGANTYGGGTVITGGTLMGSTKSLQGHFINHATLVFDQPTAGTFTGSISGSGQLIKQAAGLLILTGANNYTGGTTVAAGTLQGSTRSLQGHFLNNATVVFDQGQTGTYSGNMSGAGMLIKQAGGVLTMTGTNSYTGGTFVLSGTLVGTTRSLQGGILNNSAVVFDQADAGTYSGSMTGSGSLTKEGSGTVTLAGVNSYTGGTTVSGGTLVGDTASLQGDIVNNAAVVFDQGSGGLFAGRMSGSGSLTKAGAGLLVLTGANSYRGGTTIAAGALMGNTASLQGNMLNDATLIFDQAGAGVFGGNISGSGMLVKQGGGNLTLTGNSSYSGGTVVSAGTLIGNTRSLQGTILNDAALVFDQAESGTYAGSLFGNGSLAKRGAGALNLTGNSLQFTGNTTVSGGQLFVNGALGGGTLLMQSGTLLGGVGFIPATTVQGGAVFAPGNSIGAMRAFGNLRFEGGSTYSVETEARGPADLTLASGSLTPTGGTVAVQAGGTGYGAITRYTIFTADGGVAGTFSGVMSNIPFLNPSLQYDARNVYLTLRRNDIDFHPSGPEGNPSEVAEVLNELVGGATGALADAVNHLYEQDADRQVEALRSMSGIMYQYVARSSLDASQMFVRANMRRLALVSRGGWRTIPNASLGGGAQAYGDAAADSTYGFWLNGLGGVTKYRGDGGDSGARVPARGIIGGFDAALGNNWTIGVSGGQLSPEVTLDLGSDRSATDMWQAGFYGRYGHKASRIDAAVGLSRQDSRTTRIVTDGVVTSASGATFHGETVSSHVEYGYTLDLGNGFSLEPQAALQFGRLSWNGFDEDGAGVLSLAVRDHSVLSRRLVTGARVGKSFEAAGARMMLEGRGGWAHQFGRLDDLGVRFQGDSLTGGFNVALPDQLYNGAVLGFGFAGDARKTLTFFADLEAEIGGPVKSWRGNVGMNKSW